MARQADELAAHIAAVKQQHPGSLVDCYVLFESHTDAMALFEAAKCREIDARVSPTPRAARASCGVALLISCDDAHRMRQVACDEGVSIEGIVALPRQIDPKRDRYC
jgi:hypothetical protein